MKRNYFYALLAAFAFLSTNSYAQQWTGPSSSGSEIYRTGRTGVGLVNPPDDTQLYVKSNNLKVGIVAETFHNLDYQFGILSAVNRPNTKAFSVLLRNAAGNYEDTFTVMGDGTVKAPGFFAQVDHTQDYQIGISSAVNRANSKAFSVLLKNNSGVYEDKFAVMGDGRVLATEVEVKTNIFPDYVFADDYDLKSINELEAYINKNHHLPNIPSAKTVIDNGMSLGDMQIKQMEKIEELTLYIIKLNKKIEELEEKLEKEINSKK